MTQGTLERAIQEILSAEDLDDHDADRDYVALLDAVEAIRQVLLSGPNKHLV